MPQLASDAGPAHFRQKTSLYLSGKVLSPIIAHNTFIMRMQL